MKKEIIWLSESHQICFQGKKNNIEKVNISYSISIDITNQIRTDNIKKPQTTKQNTTKHKPEGLEGY